jgi:hypothetical protein
MIELRPIRDNERVAVALPTRDRHSYLSVLPASLAAQTYTNWMTVINDDSESPVAQAFCSVSIPLDDCCSMGVLTGHVNTARCGSL